MPIPLDMEFREVSQVGNPTAVFITVTVIRAIILMAVGVMVKTLLSQLDQKQKLVDRLRQTECKTGVLRDR